MSSQELGFFQKLSQLAGHPVSWLGITLFVVLIAYMWMEQVTNEIPDEPVKKLSPETSSTNLEEAESIIKQETMAISNSSDQTRAQEYLEAELIENSIEPLFKAADQHMDLGQYVLPENDNAWHDFEQILALSADNTQANAGQTRIRNLLIDNAETALESGDLADAENWLVRLDVIDPQGAIQKDIRSEIKSRIELEAKARLEKQKEQERTLKIKNALTQAKEEEENFPINYNKIKDLYNRVLELDPENSLALTGLDHLIDKILDQAEATLRNDSLDESQAYLLRARRMEPENKRLSSLQLALDSKLAQVEAQQQQEAAELQASNTESVKTDAIDEIVSTLDDSKIVEDVTAEEVATKQQQAQLEEGIQAYYDGKYNKSFELLYPLAENGDSRAQFRIGVMYRYGRSVTQNADLSEKWFTEALPSILNLAQRGSAWAQTDLGTAYEIGISLNQNYERAAYWYRQAAEQGYAGAQTNLGVLYANGQGVDYSRSEAILWLTKAAQQGDLVAVENLRILGVEL
jgi:hypothetical protein